MFRMCACDLESFVTLSSLSFNMQSMPIVFHLVDRLRTFMRTSNFCIVAM